MASGSPAGGRLDDDGPAASPFQEGRLRGIAIAAEIADELVRLTGADDGGGGDDTGALRDAHMRLERALDAAFDALGEVIDLAVGAAARRTAGTDGAAPPPRSARITCTPGATASCPVWLHNTTRQPAPPLTVEVGEIRSQCGDVLDAEIVLDPASVARLPAGTSASVAIHVTPAPTARPGEYFGLVFTRGLAEEPLPIRVVIEPLRR